MNPLLLLALAGTAWQVTKKNFRRARRARRKKK